MPRRACCMGSPAWMAGSSLAGRAVAGTGAAECSVQSCQQNRLSGAWRLPGCVLHAHLCICLSYWLHLALNSRSLSMDICFITFKIQDAFCSSEDGDSWVCNSEHSPKQSTQSIQLHLQAPCSQQVEKLKAETAFPDLKTTSFSQKVCLKKSMLSFT